MSLIQGQSHRESRGSSWDTCAHRHFLFPCKKQAGGGDRLSTPAPPGTLLCASLGPSLFAGREGSVKIAAGCQQEVELELKLRPLTVPSLSGRPALPGGPQRLLAACRSLARSPALKVCAPLELKLGAKLPPAVQSGKCAAAAGTCLAPESRCCWEAALAFQSRVGGTQHILAEGTWQVLNHTGMLGAMLGPESQLGA